MQCFNLNKCILVNFQVSFSSKTLQITLQIASELEER